MIPMNAEDIAKTLELHKLWMDSAPGGERAHLSGADLDFATWPLWCGSKGVRVDRRIAAQLAAHFCVLECDDPDYQTARDAVLPFARSSHRAEELGLISDIFPAPNNGPRVPGGWVPVDEGDDEGDDEE